MNIRKFYLFTILALGTAVAAFSQPTADITEISRQEQQLHTNDSIIEVTLSGTGFEDGSPPRDIHPDAFTLVDAPPGLVITRIQTQNASTADVTLRKTIDFDVSYSYAYITIHDSVLTTAGNLDTDSIEFVAHVESAGMSSSPAQLNENNMDGTSYLLISLTDENFVNSGADLDSSHFTLMNFPPGVVLRGMRYADDDEAHVYIQYQPGDFDGNFLSVYVDIDPDVLIQSTSDLSTSTISVLANDESVSVFSTQYMTEFELDDGQVIIDLVDDETTITGGSIDSVHFRFDNFPAGTWIEDIISNGTGDRVTFDFNYTPVGDLEGPLSPARIAVRPTILTWNKLDSLSTGDITINASTESGTVTAYDYLDERFLDNGMIEITLSNDLTRIKNGSIDSTFFRWDDFPLGTSIESITSNLAGDVITINLDFDNSYDFDDPVTTAEIAIRPGMLTFNLNDSIPVSVPTINDYDEMISVVTSTVPSLDEYDLDGRVLTAVITDDWIVNTSAFDENDLVLNTNISNLIIESVVVIDTNEFEVHLAQPAYEDFDTDDTLSITINDGILNYSAEITSVPPEDITALDENPSSAITPDASLGEYSLNDRTITVQLSEEWLSDMGGLVKEDITLVGAPPELTIRNLTINDSTRFVLDLNFVYVDFDSNIPIEVSIPAAELYHSGAPLVSTNSLNLMAYVETPVAIVTPDTPLEEYNLPGRSLDIELQEEWIQNTGTFDLSDLNLSGAPADLVISGLAITDSMNFTITLDHSYVDFDLDSSLTVLINHAELVQTPPSDDLESQSTTITARLENPGAALTAPVALVEYDLGGLTVEVQLTEEWVRKTETLLVGDLALMDGSEGLEIESVVLNDSSLFTITLRDAYHDFDTDSLMYIIINRAKLLQSETTDLVSDSVTVQAVVENPSSSISPKTPLNEYYIDQEIITLVMDEEWIIDPGTFSLNDVELVDAPAGIFLENLLVLDTNSFSVTLRDTIIDFDGDSLLRISVDRTKLVQSISEGVDLLSDSIPVIHYPESPVAHLTPSSWLREFFLDTMSLDIQLEEEAFRKYISINTGDFGIENGPTGLTIGGLANLADSSVTLQLAFNGTDFDSHVNNVMIAINSEVLVQQETDSLETAPFTIRANIEPVVSTVTYPNDTAMIGDVIRAVIDLAEFTTDSVYVLAPGAEIGGYPLDSMKQVNDSRYNAWFTIAEGGTDYPATDPVPVTGLRLDDLPMPGVTYSGDIVQGADLLDANKPVVSSLSIIGQGDKQIDDDVIILISAFEEGLVPEDTTEVNGVLMTEPNMVFEEIGGGTYTLTYNIEAGDPNVDPGQLNSKVYLRDYAGNINIVYPDIDTNVLSVDANVPVITYVTLSTPEDTVIIGDQVRLTVQADEDGYILSEDSEINGVQRDEGLIFTPLGSSIYLIDYPVMEFDPLVAFGDLEARVVLEDAAGNRSIPDTVIDDNTIAVLTERPTARLTGNDEICIYDTANLYVTLTGAPPWRVKYHDADTNYFIEDIQEEDYTLRIVPDSTMTYGIDSVWDGTGNHNTGLGTSVVIVNELPVVDILNLDAVYSLTAQGHTLDGEPSNGSFSGPGVITHTSFFNPLVAGLTEGTPHWIRYEYTDSKGCFKADSQSVEITDADVDFIWDVDDHPFACYLDEEFTLRAVPTSSSGVPGTFSIDTSASESFPPGFMTDNLDNSATFRPSLLEWTRGDVDYEVEYKIIYDYYDEDDVELSWVEDLVVEFYDTATIDNDLRDNEFCSNQSAIELNGSRDAPFYGPGVVDLGNLVYEFDPGEADIGENWIFFEFQESVCIQRDSALIIVHEAPDPDFEYLDSCLLSDGGMINFINLSDTSGIGSLDSIAWEWNYGDIASGELNSDVFHTHQGGSHWYPGPGRRTVTLTGTYRYSDDAECKSFESITKDLGNTPMVSIGWDTECFSESAISFSGSSLTEDNDSTFRWRITDMEGNELLVDEGDDLIQFDHSFTAIDNYSIEFTAITENNCYASIADTIYLRPYIQNITAETPYSQDFEGNALGWFSFGHINSPQNSWKFETVGETDFPYDLPDNGNKAWYTDLVRKDTFEQSWVSSPCFNFSNMRRPMISLDRKISSDRDRDGAVLQYTINDGQTWQNVGAVDDGSIEWYNTFRIQNGPGSQGEGWTGEFVFDPSEPWKQSRHDLDVLVGKPRVQFRIAYGSAGTSIVANEGFAFDNIWIGERSRVVLIEHFTNSGDGFSNDRNGDINELVANNPLDVIDIQYHAELGTLVDQMNKDNPAPASSRSLFYSTQQVPYALIDGGLSEMAYDFDDKSQPFDTLDLFTRALVDPSFEIKLDVVDTLGALEIDIDLKALEDLPETEYIVHTVIIERLINAQDYWGPRVMDTAFQNVVRAMAPNSAGTSLLRSWTTGDTEELSISWESSEKILNRGLLAVVVFVQEASTREVFQAASNDPDLNGNPVIISIRDYMSERDLSLMVYPNPARNEAFVVFDGALKEDLEIQLYSHTGSLVRNALVPAGYRTYRLDVNGLSEGVYLIRAVQRDRVVGTRRLMIIK